MNRSAAQTILIVEDEASIARLLQLELEREGFNTIVCSDGESGLAVAKQPSVDLVLLDIMLPQMDGREVLCNLRQTRSVPVIFLTARGALEDKVLGLEDGADDYIVKPFEMAEVTARVRSLLRRVQGAVRSETVLRHGQLSLNEQTHIVMMGQHTVELTKKEFELLRYMMQNSDRVCTRAEILKAVWGFDYMGDTNLIDVYMRYLRSKIDDVYQTQYIKTIRGFGYKMEEAGCNDQQGAKTTASAVAAQE